MNGVFATRFLRDRRGTSAIEFALIAPVYFLLVFGILEIAMTGWATALVAEGAERGAEYMREQRLTGEPVTESGKRAAVCASISIAGLSCENDRLKIATINASAPTTSGFGVSPIIENLSDPLNGAAGQYILAVGYNWDVYMPTSRLLLPQGDDGSQIQGRTFTVLAERVWD